MRLFRALITGGEVTDFEKALGEGLRVLRRHALADVTIARNRSIFVSLGLNEHPLNRIQVNCTLRICPMIDIQARYDIDRPAVSNLKPDENVRNFGGTGTNSDGNMESTKVQNAILAVSFIFGVRKTARYLYPM